VPDGVLDVVRIDRAVGFELRAAVLIPAGVVQGDPPLPQLRRRCGQEFHQRVEAGGRFDHATGLEIRDGAIENRLWLLRRKRHVHQQDGDRQHRSHFRKSTAISVSLSFRAKSTPPDSAG
jgi:hypothetical protein